MKRQNILKILFLSLVLSSCGLIEKWKTPEQPTDSKETSTESSSSTASNSDANVDDLFSQTMNETKSETALNETKSDAPSNINTEAPAQTDELKALEDEFSGSTSQVTAIEKSAPVKVEETMPEIKEEIADVATNADAGKVMSYKVHKGETLMQIAFKIYGDISKWKELKDMNGSKISRNSALRANMVLKYKAPEKEFVWNPEGTPYMIKNGETLGTISNSVYQTPKKWKKIWENNKPLIKNPNVIYAGFTLYYKSAGMANYVQPKALQKNVVEQKAVEKAVEEVKVEQALTKAEEVSAQEEGVIDLTKEVQSAPVRDISDEIKADEALEKQLED